MKGSFSFNENPVLFIQRIIPHVIHGVEKIISIYFSGEQESLKGHTLVFKDSDYHQEEVEIDPSDFSVQKMRSDHTPFLWMGKGEIPFEIIAKEKVQLNIFNEFNNNILLIKVKNRSDNLSDLFFIYFNREILSMGTGGTTARFSAENKTVIGNILRNVILILTEKIQQDREKFLALSENTNIILSELKVSRNAYQEVVEKSKESMVQLALCLLREFETDLRKRFRFTAHALEKIRAFGGEPASLRIIIEKAVQFAEISNPDPDREVTEIHDHHIIYPQPGEKKSEKRSSDPPAGVPQKYVKTLLMLDRLELAARNAKSRNLLLTSQNIGSQFSRPVTPPAITDALKKHRSRIVFLFKEYPDRWETIRNEFRPVQNLLNSLNALNARSA